MNRIQDELTSERALKKFLRESDFAFLEMLSARISAALDEKRAEHIEQEKLRRQREEKRNELLALIESEGFSPTELVSTTPAKKSAKRKKLRIIEALQPMGVPLSCNTFSPIARLPGVLPRLSTSNMTG